MPVTVTDPENEVSPEVLASSILKISDAMEQLHKSGLNEEAVIVLLHDKTKVAKKTIKLVMHSIRQLSTTYCYRTGLTKK